MRINLSGKVAIVTGSSRGIGRAIALMLADCGAQIVINYRDRREDADAVVAEITKRDRQAIAVQADVTSTESANRLVEAALDHFGKLHILVNNAGFPRDNMLLRMTEDDWDAVMNVNLRASFLLSKAAIRPMLRERWGRIVSVSSVSGLTGFPGQTNFAAAKAGLIGFTKSLAQEMAQRGITVNAIAPGYIDTETLGVLSESILADAVRTIPMGEFGKVEDVAPLVSFLASDYARYITGQTFAIDGGLTMY
jgi:3-oxoacyl-[acyl-carrier protein] reductase